MSKAVRVLMSRVKSLSDNITTLQSTPPGSSAWGAIAGDISEQSDLVSALGGKAGTSHAHAGYAAANHAHEGYVAADDARLTDDRTPTAHSHAQGDVTGLGTALDGKSPTTHDHDSAYAAIDHTHAGGADPWTYVKLAEDFTTSGTTNANVTGLAFTPATGKTYYVIGVFMLRTATATVGARPGIAWPANLTDATARAEAATSLTASAIRSWGARTTQNAASTGLATTTDSHYGGVEALMVTGATTSGDFQITLASESAGTNVSIKSGSFIAYRELA